MATVCFTYCLLFLYIAMDNINTVQRFTESSDRGATVIMVQGEP